MSLLCSPSFHFRSQRSSEADQRGGDRTILSSAPLPQPPFKQERAKEGEEDEVEEGKEGKFQACRSVSQSGDIDVICTLRLPTRCRQSPGFAATSFLFPLCTTIERVGFPCPVHLHPSLSTPHRLSRLPRLPNNLLPVHVRSDQQLTSMRRNATCSVRHVQP